MYWNSLGEFLDMGGYAFFVWSSVGVVFAAMLVEVMTLRSRRTQLPVQRASASPGVGPQS